MNANTLINRIEILLYSTLISAMSGINKFRTHLERSTANPVQPSTDLQGESAPVTSVPKGITLTMRWSSIQEVLLPLVLWLVLGFAAGFLIGMINPR